MSSIREVGKRHAATMLLLVAFGIAVVAGTTWFGLMGMREAAATVRAGHLRTGASTSPGGVSARASEVATANFQGSPVGGGTFAAPVFLAQSDAPVTNEPSLAFDHQGILYVTAPGQLTVPPPQSHRVNPLWRSTDGGASFGSPVYVPNIASDDRGLGGGDSDILIDNADNVLITSLWLGNTSTAVSHDGGRSWFASPLGHPFPADDRPWFAYDTNSDSAYMVYNGIKDGIHVAKAALRNATQGTAAEDAGTVSFVQDVVAVPECPAVSCPSAFSSVPGISVRQVNGSPGTITVDPSGAIWFAYSRQGDGGAGQSLGIARSVDGGLTWALSEVAGSSAADGVSYDFQVLRSDSAGNLYVVWSTARTSGAAPQVYFSYLTHGATTWHSPVRVSTQGMALFPTLAVVSPGVVDIAYLGSDLTHGSPEAAAPSTAWGLYFAQSRSALDSATFDGAGVADVVHRGAICISGLSCSTDRSLGDFFSMAISRDGLASIVTVANAFGSAFQAGAIPGIYVFRQTDQQATASAPGTVRAQAAAGCAARPAGCGVYLPVPESAAAQPISGPLAVRADQPTAAAPRPASARPKLSLAGIRDPVVRGSASLGLAVVASGLVALVFSIFAVIVRTRSRG